MDRHHIAHYLIAAAFALGGAGALAWQARAPRLVEVINSSHVARAGADTWAPLSDAESAALAGAFKPLGLRQVDVFCLSPQCEDLADDVAAALRQAGADAKVEQPIIAPSSGLWVSAPDKATALAIANALGEGFGHRLVAQIDATPSAAPFVSFGGAQ